MESLVSTEWLANEMGASDLRIVDCTRHLPGTGRDALAEYEAGHISGAVFMDLADLVDAGAAVENTLPRRKSSPAGCSLWVWATAAASFSMMTAR